MDNLPTTIDILLIVEFEHFVSLYKVFSIALFIAYLVLKSLQELC